MKELNSKNTKALMDLSVVIPVYNEGNNIDELCRRLIYTLDKQGILRYEIIFIDDGSKDYTCKRITDVCNADKKVKLIRLSRNFGQAAALAAGFDNSYGRIIVTLDGDLQHSPEDIPKLLEKMKEGYDIVSGWRKHRIDGLIMRRLPSLIANKIIRLTSGVKLHDFGSTLKAYKREVIENIELYGELHRFIPALASWQGISIAEVPITNTMRRSGKSKYGISRTFSVILDILTVKFLTSYISRPLHFFGAIGTVFFGIGFLVAILLTVGYYFLDLQIKENLGNLIFSMLMMTLGFQLTAIGLSLEVSTRIYHHTGKRKIYVIKDVISKKDLV